MTMTMTLNPSPSTPALLSTNPDALRLGISSAVPKRKWRSMLEVTTPEEAFTMGGRMFTLMNLAWDFIDSIMNLCASMKLKATKPICRMVREVHRQWQQDRAPFVDDKFARHESERAEIFLEEFTSDFDKLFYGLEMEVSKLKLLPDYKTLVIAVHQALTVMDAVLEFASDCDAVIRGRGLIVNDHCMVNREFLRLYQLVPLFAGDKFQPRLDARKKTARILANRIYNITFNFLKDGERPPEEDY